MKTFVLGAQEAVKNVTPVISGKHNTATNVADLGRGLVKRRDKQWNPCTWMQKK